MLLRLYNFGKQNMVGSAGGSETRDDCSAFSSYSVYSSGEATSVLDETRPRGASPCRRPWNNYTEITAFSFSGPAEWNCLPNDLRMITDTNVFKKKLKAYFYKQAFCVA